MFMYTLVRASESVSWLLSNNYHEKKTMNPESRGQRGRHNSVVTPKKGLKANSLFQVSVDDQRISTFWPFVPIEPIDILTDTRIDTVVLIAPMCSCGLCPAADKASVPNNRIFFFCIL